MAKSDDKEPRDRDAPHRQIPPVAQDQEMLFWLESLFEVSERGEDDKPYDKKAGVPIPKSKPDKFPDRVALRPLFGRRDLGAALDTRTWKPMQERVPEREHLVVMANELLGKAQEYSNVNQRRQRFSLFAYSNLRGADAYATYQFSLEPTGKDYGKEVPASDDDDTHRDRFLDSALSHNRWLTEQSMEAQGSLIRLQTEIINSQREEIMSLYAERRQMVREKEDLESRKQEREERAEMAKLKRQAIEFAMEQVVSLMPAVQIYLSQGKVGISAGLKRFVDTMTTEQKLAFFGRWQGGNLTEKGVLDADQVVSFTDLVDGKGGSIEMREFILSLRPEQYQAAAQILDMTQIQQLQALAKAVEGIARNNNNPSS